MQQKFKNIAAKLQGSSIGFQAFQLFRYGFLLLVSICLTRIYSDNATIEQYELLLLLGSSLTFFWVSGLFDGFIVAYRQANKDEQAAVLFQTFVFALPFALFSGLGCWLIGTIWLPGRVDPNALLAYSIFLTFDVLSHLLAYFMIVQQKAISLMFYGFISYLAYFLLLIVPLYLGEPLVYGMWLLAMLAGLKFAALLWYAGARLLKPAFSASASRILIRISGPLALAALLSQGAVYVDGYLVEHYFQDSFAVFRYGAKELPLVLLLANSMSIVRSGDIAAALKGGDQGSGLQRLKQSASRLIHLSFGMSIVLLLISTPLYTAVFGKGFLGSVPVFDLYLLLVIPRLLFPQSVLRGHQKTFSMTMSAGIELVLNVGLSLILMRYWGIAGIAAATVIAYFVEKMILIVYCNRVLGIKLVAYTPILNWLLWSIAIVAVWILKYTVLG